MLHFIQRFPLSVSHAESLTHAASRTARVGVHEKGALMDVTGDVACHERLAGPLPRDDCDTPRTVVLSLLCAREEPARPLATHLT